MLLVWWFLIVSLVFVIGAVVLAMFSDFEEESLMALIIVGIIGLIITGCIGIRTKKSIITRDLINNKFKTNYTVEEIFWSEEAIKNMLEGTLERKEIDINFK
ncbi:hypothetical protein LCGC14_1073050 [marine sediment metagenome]|uniref:Uncharacterized protein n=1 Tax=marine sediment metagenome TaxID=412755 RepID=A0A0F9Q0R5_9ZZZZ